MVSRLNPQWREDHRGGCLVCLKVTYIAYYILVSNENSINQKPRKKYTYFRHCWGKLRKVFLWRGSLYSSLDTPGPPESELDTPGQCNPWSPQFWTCKFFYVNIIHLTIALKCFTNWFLLHRIHAVGGTVPVKKVDMWAAALEFCKTKTSSTVWKYHKKHTNDVWHGVIFLRRSYVWFTIDISHSWRLSSPDSASERTTVKSSKIY